MKSRPEQMIENDFLVGDFKQIKVLEERKGHGQFDATRKAEFNYVVRDLAEIEVVGGMFTWSNGIGQHHTQTKLDKDFGNENWFTH